MVCRVCVGSGLSSLCVAGYADARPHSAQQSCRLAILPPGSCHLAILLPGSLASGNLATPSNLPARQSCRLAILSPANLAACQSCRLAILPPSDISHLTGLHRAHRTAEGGTGKTWEDIRKPDPDGSKTCAGAPRPARAPRPVRDPTKRDRSLISYHQGWFK